MERGPRYGAAANGDYLKNHPYVDAVMDDDERAASPVDSMTRLVPENGGPRALHLHPQNAPGLLEASEQMRRERRRRRVVCLGCWIGWLVAALAMVPLIFFVLIPAMGQYLMDASDMAMGACIITNPTTENFTLAMRGNVTHAGLLDAQIVFAEPLTLVWEGIPLAKVPMPALEYRDGVGLIDHKVVVPVLNVTAFSAFNRFMMSSEQFEWQLEGTAEVRVLGLRISDLRLRKAVRLPGFNRFAGNVHIVSFDLPGDDPVEGIHTTITTSLFNPSVVGIRIGETVFEVLANGTLLGEVTAQSLDMMPGNNTLQMSGRLLPMHTTTDARTVSALFSTFVAGGDSTLQVRGKALRMRPSPEWLVNALVGFELEAVLEGEKKMHLIRAVDINTMGMAFSAAAPYAPMLSAPNVVAQFVMPFDFPLSIGRVNQTILVIGDGIKLAEIVSGWMPAHGSSYSGTILMNIQRVPLRVLPGRERDFDNFVSKMALGKSNVTLAMIGRCDAVAETAMGDILLSDVPFRSELQIMSMNGLMTVPPRVVSMRVVGGTREGLQLRIGVELFNPSDVSLNAGDLSFDLWYSGVNFGTAVMRNFALTPGTNRVTANVVVAASQQHASVVSRLLSYQAMGKPVKTVCAGNAGSTDIASLKPAMQRMRLEMELPGLPNNMIQSTRFMITPAALTSGVATAGMTLYNSFDAPVTILRISASMTAKGNRLGTLESDLSTTPLVIPPHSTVRSHALPLNVEISVSSMLASFRGLTGSLRVDIVSDLLVRIGDYETEMHYEQQDVPSHLEDVD